MAVQTTAIWKPVHDRIDSHAVSIPSFRRINELVVAYAIHGWIQHLATAKFKSCSGVRRLRLQWRPSLY